MRIELSEGDFERVRALLAASAGLVFDECRRDSLAYSLGERVQACGLTGVDQYLALLDRDKGDELQALLNEVTIQETHFFRNPPQFRALRQHVLPQLIKRAATGSRRLRVWSAGCSTGEEPYSVAMLLRELLPLTDGWDIKVVATDVSTRALAKARAGRYGSRALNAAPPDDVARWFVKHGDEYVVRPEVRELVEFRHHNLVTEPSPFGGDEPIDLLLCRNVTIYFSRETTRRLMTQFHDALAEGGYLFLGHSETLWHVNDSFRLVTLGDAFVYRRDAAGDDRRAVLPDRRTGADGYPPGGDRRVAKGDRRSPWELLTKPRSLPFPRPARNPGAAGPVATGGALPAPAVADPVEQVRVALRDGRYAEAAALAAAAVVADPLRADAYYLHGLALANQGRDAEALAELRKAVYVDPLAGFAHFLLGGVLARLGDAQGAARSYRAAAETLGRNDDDHASAELGGRTVGELVDLCWQLAGGRRGG
ncbi:MAG TPA: CheR family methyltransferase [Frankiaceae bacterium]|nr:CheR family methyltransferase [Frankiaceae bacterium]